MSPTSRVRTGPRIRDLLVRRIGLPGPAAYSQGAGAAPTDGPGHPSERHIVGSVIKKRRKRMAKKKHRKLLKRTRVQRRNKK